MRCSSDTARDVAFYLMSFIDTVNREYHCIIIIIIINDIFIAQIRKFSKCATGSYTGVSSAVF